MWLQHLHKWMKSRSAPELIHKYFSSIWFKLPENLFPELLLVAASTVRSSLLLYFHVRYCYESYGLCTFVSSVGGKVWTSNNRSDIQWSKNELLRSFLRVLLKVLVTNYGSPEFWRTLFRGQKHSLNNVLLKRCSQNI